MPQSQRGNLADLRTGILTEMGAWSASTRQRALLHVPRLRRRVASVDVLAAHDEVPRAPGAAGRARFLATHAGRYAARAGEVRRAAAHHDALLIQRGLYVVGPGAIAAALRRFDGRIVLDLDDAVFELRAPLDSRGPATRWLWGPQQTRRLLARADAVVVSSSALAETLGDRVPSPLVLPTILDPAVYPSVPARDAGPITVGWTGTLAGLPYLDALEGVMRRLRGVAELEVVGSQPWRGPSRFRRWRADMATTLFADFDVGVMPLPDTPYTRAKAGFKLLEYMACGLPVVASPVGVNRELVTRSGAGYLASTPDEWEEALRELAARADRRAELGERGRRFVAAYCDLEGQADVLAALLAGTPPML